MQTAGLAGDNVFIFSLAGLCPSFCPGDLVILPFSNSLALSRFTALMSAELMSLWLPLPDAVCVQNADSQLASQEVYGNFPQDINYITYSYTPIN